MTVDSERREADRAGSWQLLSDNWLFWKISFVVGHLPVLEDATNFVGQVTSTQINQ